MRRAFQCFLGILVFTLPTAGLGEDFKPQVCATAVEYRGAPLHAAISAETLATVRHDLDGTIDASLSARLDQVVDWILKNTKAPGISVAVGIPGEGTWSASRGLALIDPPTPLAETPHLHWASAGKVMTAAVVMQLIDEGKLAYTDPLAKWFPDFPNASAITIDHLLTHTNGIFSFNADLPFRKQRRYHSPEECLKIAARHGCVCCPGEYWHYSNTGYVLLGLIVERVEVGPLDEVFRKRIIEPLGLRETIAMAPLQAPVSLAVGHVDGKRDPDFEPTTPFGAGIVAGSARDMLLFWNAYLQGRLVNEATVRDAFSRLYPMYDPNTYYGRGVMLYDFADQSGQRHTWLGHSGGTPGLRALMVYDVEAGVYVTVAMNAQVSAEAAANKLLGVIQEQRAAR
jgi:D-alanyl-D-alanine carboxypeptidase